MKENDKEITGNTSMRTYNKKRNLGMLYFGSEDYEKLKPFLEGKDLIYRFNKEKNELCIREQQYPEI